MKQQTWKAGLMIAAVTTIGGSMVLAAATATPPAKVPANQTATAPAKEPAKPAAPPAPAPASHEELFFPDAWKAFHNPTPWLSMGLDQRFRIEAGENWDTLNDDSSTHRWMYERYRTRWWTKSVLGDDISFNTRLVWEFRTYQDPPAAPLAGENYQKYDKNMMWDEALFDWFNVNIRNVGGMPLTAVLGRQDIAFGVGWLVLDGTPLDGSRTVGAFDAARFTYDWAAKSTKIDAIYVNRAAESDRFLKPIDDKNRGLTEQDENAAILYLTNTTFKPTQLEGFFIYKNDNPVNGRLVNVPAVWSRKAEIYTVGGAVSGTPAEHWKYRTEAAMQFGNKYDGTSTLGVLGPKRDIEAYGTLSNVEYLFKDAHENAAHVGYEYASGDDPDTQDNEEFDLLWGEWPRWSELLIYTATFETQPAALTNLHRINVGHRLNLNKKWQLTADYHALWADQMGQPWNKGAKGLNVSDDGRFRGNLVTSWLKYKFSAQLYGHFLAEYFWNGDYFTAPSDDNAYFLRFNIEYIF